MEEQQVIIIGAGPVGLTAAMDLAKRGINVTVVESRAEDEPADAKCNTVAARTLEIFRSLGISNEVRAAGLLDDFPTDVLYCTTINGEEITRIELPSRNERFGTDGHSAPGYLDSNWETPEPVVRVSQFYLNPILYQHAKSFERITLMPETAFIRYEDSSGGVTVHCERRSGESIVLKGRYLIGCDGASSAIRKQMGVRLQGDTEIGKMRSTLVRCRAIKDLFPARPAWMTWTLNQRVRGTVVAIDGDELWLIHRMVDLDKPYESLDHEQSLRDVLGVDKDFSWEEIHHQDWTARRMVAERFRDNNVFVCGDAAHIWVPFAGYGMNAGIADCTNLSWMMAAVLNGHADESILSAHERERHPITEQVSHFAMGKAQEYLDRAQNRPIPKILEKRNFIARFVRKQLGKTLYDMNAPQFACSGLNFGYYYDNSPIVAYDGESAPQYEMGEYTSSTVPGCRMPHYWIDGKTSLYDALGLNYTLLKFDDSVDVSALEAAAERLGFPVDILSCDAPKGAAWNKTKLVLVRPDQHVAWRGDAVPVDVDGLLATFIGRASENKREAA